MIAPTLHRLEATYYQDADGCDPGVDQVLTLTLEEAGGGPFVTLRTARWAIDDRQELIALLREFEAAGRPLFEKPS